MNRYTHYIFGLLCIIIIFLSIDIYYKYQQFSQYHQKLSHKTVTSTASEIETILVSLERELKLFVNQEKPLLSRLYYEPENKALKKQLENKMRGYFPEHIEFTIADHEGNIILNRDIFTAYPQCQENIKQTSENKKQALLRLHNSPGSKKQHYDIMHSFNPDNSNSHQEAVFFISYSIEPLRQLLANRQIEHHSLFVINTYQQKKIEFINEQTLLSVKKNSLSRLQAAGEEQLIEGTQWTIIDVVNPDYRKNELFILILQHVLLLIFFVIISGLFIKAIRNEIKNSTNTHLLLEGVENERRRISMEMHDHILADITHLSRKVMYSQNIDKHQINEQLLNMTTSIRSLIDDLHPNSLDLLGIEAALQSYINKHLSGIEFPDYSLKINPEIDSLLKPYQKYTLFRVLIELINNIINHAQTTSYTLDGTLRDGMIEFKIKDNGIGLKNNNSHDSGLGLNNIKSRCQMLGASLSMMDNTPKGTVTIIQMNSRD